MTNIDDIPRRGEKYPERVTIAIDVETKDAWNELRARGFDIASLCRAVLKTELLGVLSQLKESR